MDKTASVKKKWSFHSARCVRLSSTINWRVCEKEINYYLGKINEYKEKRLTGNNYKERRETIIAKVISPVSFSVHVLRLNEAFK